MPKKPVRSVKRNAKTPAKKPVPAKKVTAPAKPAKKTVPAKPAKKVAAPVRTVKRNDKNLKKPKTKKSVKELEKELGKKVGKTGKLGKPAPKVAPKAAPKKLSRSEQLKQADKKLNKSGVGKLRKMPKLNIAPIEDMKQKLLTENENKEVLAARNALKRRLQRVANFAKTVQEHLGDKVAKVIQTVVGFDARLNQIQLERTGKQLGDKKQRLQIEDADSEVQSSSRDFSVTAAPRKKAEDAGAPKAMPQRVDQGFIANELKRLNLRAGSRTVFTEKNEAFRHMFGGKEPAVISFSNVGTFQATTYLDKHGKRKHAYYGFQVPFDNEKQVENNWHDLIDNIARATNMRYLPSVGPKHVFSNLMLRQFANKAEEFNFFVKNSGTHFAFLGRVENDVVYGMYVSYVSAEGSGQEKAGIIFGYWCGVGVTVRELKTLSMGRFDEHFDSSNPDPKVTQFLGHSMMTQFYNTSNRVPQASVADISLTRPVGTDASIPDFIGKSESGAILYVPNVDLRDKFDDWVNDMALPDELSREDLVPGTQLTEREYFAGRIVYTDMKNKIMFYYSKNGDLHKFDFSSAAELNTRDRSELTKSKSSDPDYIKKNRDTQSFYGTSFFFREGDYALVSDYSAAQKTFDMFKGFKFDGFRDDVTDTQKNTFQYSTGRSIYVTIEGLRDSYKGDKLLYDMVEKFYEELSLNASYYYSQGHRDVIADEDSEREKEETGRFGMRDLVRAPQIGMMLNIAKKGYDEWPHETDLRTKAKEQLRKMTSPSREDLDAVIGSFDGLVKDKNGNYPRLMPHQVETLAIMRNTNTAALDVDMGGGKTVMSVLDMTRLIREGITLEDGTKLPGRCLVVMPGSTLVRNYISDVQKFFGRNVNVFTLETDQTVKREFSMNDIVERMQNAPSNTIFVTTYSWIIGGGAYDMPLNTEVQKDGSIRVISKRVYPRVEMLKRVPITAVYLDESHKIKNKTSNQNRAAVALSDVPVKRILTGTMVSKDAGDIFQQMRFLDSTLIGSEARFVAQYGAVDDGNGKKAKRGDLRPGAEKEARAEIRANGVLQLRRTAWLPLLPEKDEKFHFVNMSEEHEALYKAMLMKLVATPKEALEKGLINQNQYELLIKLGSILGLAGNEGDDDDAGTLAGRAGAILGDGDGEEDGEDGEDKKHGGRSKQANSLERVQQNMAVMIAMMQDFLTAPELLDPTKFDSDPAVLEAMKNAGLIGPDGKMVGFAVGPKDQLVLKIIKDHFAKIGGTYIKRSEQERLYGDDKKKYAGKVIIFHENVNAATHFYNTLRKAGIKGVGMYQAGDVVTRASGASEADLAALKDPEDISVSILCAAEKALLLGHNMQAANVVIRLSTPWTVGDYDQSLARAFRNGQDLDVYCHNIQVDSSFEVLKLIKLFVRESSNKKLNSDFDVPFELSKKLAECSLENHLTYAKQSALIDFPVNRYSVPGRPEAGMYESTANLFVELHEEIWKQEKLAAYGTDEKKARAKDVAYLSNPANNCEAARYFRMGLDKMSEMASGEENVMPMAAEVTPKRADGSPTQNGELSEHGLDALFNGFVNPADRKDVRNLKKHEAGMLARQADPGSQLRQIIEESFDAMVETKPMYEKRYGVRRDEIIDELYADFTNLEAKNSKSFNIFGYAGPHATFILGLYNMVASKYANLGVSEVNLKDDTKLSVRTAKRNAELIAGRINTFRKANNIEDTEDVDLEDGDENDNGGGDEDNGDDDQPVQDDDEQEEEVVRDTLLLGLSKYFSDASESTAEEEAKVMLFAPLSSANKLAKKLDKFILPSALKFQKRIRYVYTRSEITSALQIKGVLQKIEAAGGNIEAKNENGKYELVESDVLRVLMSSKAPSTKLANSEHSIHNIVRDKNHLVTSKVAGKKAQNIDCGFLVLDGRITLAAFPDNDAVNFNAREAEILQKCGFKRIEYMVVIYKNNPTQLKKLVRDLNAIASKFNKEGVDFHNEAKFEKHVKAFTKIPVDFASQRG